MKSMVQMIDGDDVSAGVQAIEDAGFNSEFCGVYRNNSASAFRDALLRNYPTILTLVGDENASLLARKYRKHYPVTSRTLLNYGHEFPTFLTTKLDLHGLVYLESFAVLDPCMDVRTPCCR